MKSIISLLAIPVVAMLLVVGCNPNKPNPSDSPNPSATNSSVSGTNNVVYGNTNLPTTNVISDVTVNKPAGTNQ